MRLLYILAALLVCTACANTNQFAAEEHEYKRIEYYEAVFLPASQQCSRAGGFMIFEDAFPRQNETGGLSYGDMRMAVARGCGGI